MKFLVVCRRELRSYFSSYIAYVLLAVFLLLSGYFFYSDLIFFVTFGFGMNILENFWQLLLVDLRLVMLLSMPLLTMRLFAEEKKLGTIELLWTYPVSDAAIVMGKFLAAWIFFLIMLLPTVINPVIFYQFYHFDIGPLLAAYAGMFMLGTAFIACGLFVSSLTENQVVSAMVTYGILVFFWFVTWNEEVADQQIVRALLRLSLFDHFFNFSRGVIDTRDLIFFALFVGLFLFLTLQSLGSRAWRGVR